MFYCGTFLYSLLLYSYTPSTVQYSYYILLTILIILLEYSSNTILEYYFLSILAYIAWHSIA